ncbi:hypothetical protein Dsin_021884 [Dipteronia sinensis]|uniref:CCHC-type domain-containing protein n=1 Tax=Dipteronia sinensis TaxID=43782 RepID=A0AAE0A0K0_9ROSI|nr:hypothetical protein Dsin_021884 [Dipteronia sinensis]
MARILAGSPWHFDRAIIVLVKPSGLGDIQSLSFNLVDFWVQIHNLPLLCSSRDIRVFLGKMIGDVKDIDLDTGKRDDGRFIRVRVGIRVDEPLKRCLRVDIKGSVTITTMLLRYERLQDYCFKCGRLGHSLIECSAVGGIRDFKSENSLRLCAWLRTNSPPKKSFSGNSKQEHRNWGRFKGASGSNSVNRMGSRSTGDWRENKVTTQNSRSDGRKLEDQQPRKSIGNVKSFKVICMETEETRAAGNGNVSCGNPKDDAINLNTNKKMDRVSGGNQHGPVPTGLNLLMDNSEIKEDVTNKIGRPAPNPVCSVGSQCPRASTNRKWCLKRMGRLG